MKKNLFKGAKFGDKFRTIDGRMAIYHCPDNVYGYHFLIVEDGDNLIVADDGTCSKNIPEEYRDKDIVVSR